MSTAISTAPCTAPSHQPISAPSFRHTAASSQESTSPLAVLSPVYAFRGLMYAKWLANHQGSYLKSGIQPVRCSIKQLSFCLIQATLIVIRPTFLDGWLIFHNFPLSNQYQH